MDIEIINPGTIEIENLTTEIHPELEDLTITPTINAQKYNHKNTYGYDEVIVEPVTKDIDPNIKSENIKNGVDILGVSGNLNALIGETITIKKNGQYLPTSPSNGFTEVNVETSGVDINDYYETTGSGNFGDIKWHIKKVPPLDFTGVTSIANIFENCSKLGEIPNVSNTSSLTNISQTFNKCVAVKEIDLSNWNVSNVKYATWLFKDCNAVKKINISNWNLDKCTEMTTWFQYDWALQELYINNINTSKITNMYGVFSSCSSLNKIVGLFQGDSLINLNTAFSRVGALTDFNGFENLGKAYDTSQEANYGSYTLDLSECTKLTHDSLVSIINNLYDINTKGCNAQQLKIGATNIAKLTSEEIAIATSKGWTVS